MKHLPLNTKYLISEDGLTIINEITGRRIKIGDQQIKGRITGYKYASIIFDDNEYHIKRMSVHRLVALTYLEAPTDKQVWVNHKDGNKSNNHYTNLEWTTISENIQHAHDTGLKVTKKGIESPLYGTKHSLQTKYKQSISKIGDKHPKFKGYYYANYKKYGSCGEASRATGMNAKSIYNKCHKNDKLSGFWFDPVLSPKSE